MNTFCVDYTPNLAGGIFTKKDWCYVRKLDYQKFKKVPVGAFRTYQIPASEQTGSEADVKAIADKIKNSVIFKSQERDEPEMFQVFQPETETETISRLTKLAEEIDARQFFQPKQVLDVEWDAKWGTDKKENKDVLLLSIDGNGQFNGCHFIAKDEVDNITIVGNEVFVKSGKKWEKR